MYTCILRKLLGALQQEAKTTKQFLMRQKEFLEKLVELTMVTYAF